MEKPKGGMRRRDVLKGAGGLAAATAITGFPYVARGQGDVIRIGMPTILSGRVAILGQSSRDAALLATSQFNEAGGVNGKTIELVIRDSKGQPDEAARITRDLINTDGCEIILDAEASSAAFAVQEVIRELPVLCIHTNSETSALTADPKLRVPTGFRSARQGIHDAIAGGRYAANLAKDQSLKTWMTVSPDYAYGRDNTAQFLEYLKIFDESVEVVDQAWPKLFEPDYTAYVTRVLQTAPNGLYSALWGGDLVAFVEQANLYGLFAGDITFFSANMADPPIVEAIGQMPEGARSVYRYDPNYPDTEANAAFYEAYMAMAEVLPTNWSWENYTGMSFIFEALRRTNGVTDGAALAAELKDLEIDSPFTESGKIIMRGEDQTLIRYPVAWGRSTTDPRGFTDWVAGDWEEILELEAEWKARQGYA
jgi:branched-chain amino acid transport system substrate-binding protein